jgi:hypothetical protein
MAKRHDPYIPRPARLEIRIEDHRVVCLKLENSQARHLVRLLRDARAMAPTDESLADLIMASVGHELAAHGDGEDR